MLSVSGADHIITMDLHASQIQVGDVELTKAEASSCPLGLVLSWFNILSWSICLILFHLKMGRNYIFCMSFLVLFKPQNNVDSLSTLIPGVL